MNKYWKFAKNLALGCISCVAGGTLGSELSDLVSDSEELISISSTASQFVVSYATLFTFHARDNPDLYRTRENKFRVKEFAKDCGKMMLGIGVLDYLYFTGRTFLHYYFQKKGYSPFESSLLADSISLPAFFAAAIPLCKYLGVIREETKNE